MLSLHHKISTAVITKVEQSDSHNKLLLNNFQVV